MVHSRQKGARGEREVRDILRRHGYEARRDGRLDTDVVHDMSGFHLEVKRREKYELDKWIGQAEEDAAEGETPVVVFRKSGQPWRAVIGFDVLVALITNQNEGESSGSNQLGAGGTVQEDPREARS